MPLTSKQINEFAQENVLIARNILTDTDLQPVIDGISEWISRRSLALQAEGKIDDLHENEPFDRRFACLYRQCPEIDDGLDIMYMKARSIYEFMRNVNLMDAAKCLVGPEITCNPIQHLRAKVPVPYLGDQPCYSGVSVPWHQDAAVTWEEADPTNIVTCWIPLVDATFENGCMRVIPGNKTRGYIEHEHVGDTRIKPQFMPEMQPRIAECPKGGVIFMSKFTPHSSTDNVGDTIRWSLDLRYQPTGEPTGRPFWPSFVTHSTADPMTVHTDYEDWRFQWDESLEKSKDIKWHRTQRKK